MRRIAARSLLAGAAAACGPHPEPTMSAEEAMDPEECRDCHPRHYDEWLSSMHAYASEDPVFIAMNRLGQERTGGELGDFCVRCHAPLAVELGLTTDGADLDQVPAHLRGIGCYVCHNVVDVAGEHNNPLVLGLDGTLRGGIEDPDTELAPHAAEWSKWLAGSNPETRFTSAQMCGSCHDIVTPAGVHLERTYAEWQGSLYADTDEAGVLPGFYSQSCVDCHMGPAEKGPAADVEGVRGDRFVHAHSFPGVDVQLTDFPDAEQGPAVKAAQLLAIQEGINRQGALCSGMCVKPADGGGFDVRVWLHNEGAGHHWPTGAVQDRRAWVELVAYDGATAVHESGVVGDKEPVALSPDPDLWLLRDRMLDAGGNEVHMFWEAREVEGEVLEVAVEVGPEADAATWRWRDYHVDAPAVDRVTSRVRLRPMGLEVLDELIAEGVLDPVHRAAIATFDMPSTGLEWTPADGDAFCASSKVDCGDYGSCIAPKFGGQFAVTCTPPEIRAP